MNNGEAGNIHGQAHGRGQDMDSIWGASPAFSPQSTASGAGALQSLVNPPVDPHADITPSILLEQLAFVDNFMTDFNSELGADVTNSFYNGQDATHSGGLPFNNSGFGAENDMSSEMQLAVDERLAAELSVFADETFIFPDEDKADRNDSSDNHDGNGNNNGNSNGRNPSEKRNLFDRKSNLAGNQYDHTRQRFSRKRNSAQDSPIPDHSGFTNFDAQGGGNSSNSAVTGNGNVNMNNLGISNASHQRDMPFAASPLTNLLAAQDLSSQPFSENTVSSQATTHSTLNHNTTTPSATEFRARIQMPDYSAIQTSTLVSLLPRLAVPRGAHNSLQNVGFRPEQIDAIAAIMAYYEREKDRFNPPVRTHSSDGQNNHYSTTNSGSVISSSLSQNMVQPQEQLQSSVSMLLDFLHDKPHTNTASSGQEPVFKKARKTSTSREVKREQPREESMDRYIKDSPRAEVELQPTVQNNQSSEQSNSPFAGKKDEASDAGLNAKKHDSASQRVTEGGPDVNMATSDSQTHRPKDSSNDWDTRNTSEGSGEGVEFTTKSKSEKSEKRKSVSVTAEDGPSSSSSSTSSRPKLPNLDQPKKLKEKEMETWVQDLSELARDLKQRINTLEMENRLLKDLVIERGDFKSMDSSKSSKKDKSAQEEKN